MVQIDKIIESDIDDIIKLLEPHVQKGIVLQRNHDEIMREQHCFFIARIDGVAAGVVSFHDYDNHLYEIRSLVVADKYAKTGVGKALVSYVVDLLRVKSQQARIFALTYVPEFFTKLNFEPVDKSYFPEKIWKDCVNCPRKDCCTEIALINRG
ncbi:MAG: GNAT family N-acetyltransferase [Spirochaetes bacterium]|jgi:amino-acid N-acetyltransferase|nr:GNAT family N-acetyltransferase [Spirochaetota bacterium]